MGGNLTGLLWGVMSTMASSCGMWRSRGTLLGPSAYEGTLAAAHSPAGTVPGSNNHQWLRLVACAHPRPPMYPGHASSNKAPPIRPATQIIIAVEYPRCMPPCALERFGLCSTRGSRGSQLMNKNLKKKQRTLTFSRSTQGTGQPSSLDARSRRNTCRTRPVLCAQQTPFQASHATKEKT